MIGRGDNESGFVDVFLLAKITGLQFPGMLLILFIPESKMAARGNIYLCESLNTKEVYD